MDDGFEVVVRFECVSKIRYDSDRHTTEHKSKFALGMLQGRPCIQLWEKAANFPKLLKVCVCVCVCLRERGRGCATGSVKVCDNK